MDLMDVRPREQTVYDVWCNHCETVVDTMLRPEDAEQVSQEHAELHCPECRQFVGHRPDCTEALKPTCPERAVGRQCEVHGPHTTHGYDLGKPTQALWRPKATT